MIQKFTGNDKKNIIFASRLVWEKNLKVLVELYELIQKQVLPYNLIVAGDGLAKEELEQMMPSAYFTGYMNHDHLSELYASSDYFVFTSITETFGNVITEAMASGLPCLIADGGGSKSLIKQGINGFLCKPHQAKDYLHKIQLLEEHPEFCRMMKIQAIKDVSQLSWDHLVQSLFTQMKELVLQSRNKRYTSLSI